MSETAPETNVRQSRLTRGDLPDRRESQRGSIQGIFGICLTVPRAGAETVRHLDKITVANETAVRRSGLTEATARLKTADRRLRRPCVAGRMSPHGHSSTSRRAQASRDTRWMGMLGATEL